MPASLLLHSGDLCSRAPLAVRAGRWGTDARSKHFCHQGKPRVKPDGTVQGWPEVIRSFSQPSQCECSLLAPCLTVPQLVFGFLLREFAAYVAVFGVHTGDGKVSTSYDAFGSESHQGLFSEL